MRANQGRAARPRIGIGIGIAAALALAACGGKGGGAPACDPTTSECVIEADVSTTTVAAGAEDNDLCQSWTLDNKTELWVNAIGQSNDGGYHHANWFFVPDNLFPLPDGTWSCSAQNFVELNAALLGGYLFALSTQSHGELQSLPAGSAIRIPPYSRVIGASHLLNTADAPVTTTMHLALHTIPLAEVKAKMVPARFTYHDLHLDPSSKSSFTGECLFGDQYQQDIKQPFAYKLHYALGHYHGLGSYIQAEVAGGPHDGQVIYRHDGYGENLGVALDPPVDLAALGAHGVRVTCGYDNPRPVEVGWGVGDQEMCVMAFQAETQMAWDGEVQDGTGAATGVTADGGQGHRGPCNLAAFQWDFEKAGGPPP